MYWWVIGRKGSNSDNTRTSGWSLKLVNMFIMEPLIYILNSNWLSSPVAVKPVHNRACMHPFCYSGPGSLLTLLFEEIGFDYFMWLSWSTQQLCFCFQVESKQAQVVATAIHLHFSTHVWVTGWANLDATWQTYLQSAEAKGVKFLFFCRRST